MSSLHAATRHPAPPRTDAASRPADRTAARTDAQAIAGPAAKPAIDFAKDPLSLLTIGGAIVFGALALLVALG